MVEDFLVPKYGLASTDFFLVYVGKVLKGNKELNEEYLKDGSEVTLVMHKHAERRQRVVHTNDSNKLIKST